MSYAVVVVVVTNLMVEVLPKYAFSEIHFQWIASAAIRVIQRNLGPMNLFK